ncbi:methyltransferase domain-containing protein [Spiractinospora alimapuensis]|nr:methyltransferase domain-containing protein [Spiractinospora alimapuensis]
MDQSGVAEQRHRLLAGLTGDVVEVGAGDGGNFAHYPPSVRHVLATEPEPHLRHSAHAAATTAPVPVTVVAGRGEEIPADTGHYDAVVFTLVLCSVADQAAVLRETARVLKPGGQIRFLEHVVGGGPAMRRTQRVLDATVWPRLAGGCHLGRDTLTAIQEAGFTIDDLDRFLLPERATPASYHIRGIGHRASD